MFEPLTGGMSSHSLKGMSFNRRLAHTEGYLALGLIDEAEAQLDALTPGEASTFGAILLRLGVLQARGRWAELRDVASEAICRGLDDPPAWIAWACAARRVDSLATATAVLREAEKQHPKEPTIQFNLGCYAALSGDIAEARRRVARAVALDPAFSQLAVTDPDLAALRSASGTSDWQSGT